MANILKIKRGTKTGLPGLSAGEPGFCTDSFQLFVGTDGTTGGNKLIGPPDYIKVSDVKTNGTHGGDSTAGDWYRRDINTEDADAGGFCSISSNQITLAAGTYLARITAPANTAGTHRIRLQNITDSTTTLLGGNEFAAASNMGTRATLVGTFTITAQKTFEVQHRVGTGLVSTGLGRACNFGISEIYTEAEFWKIR